MRLFCKEGVFIWLDPEWDVISRRIMDEGEWEYPQARLINTLGRADWTFVDIGAHIGYFSLRAAPHYGEVVAYEPTAYACELHRKSIDANGFTNVAVEQCAVPSDGFIHADVLKIDIDGGEQEVFAQHPELLDAHAIFFEYAPAVANGFNPITFLQDAGFRILHEHGQPLTDRIPYGVWSANFIALRDVDVPCLWDGPPVWGNAVVLVDPHKGEYVGVHDVEACAQCQEVLVPA
jgi:hypothetical protein